jgi:hypothetical protein
MRFQPLKAMTRAFSALLFPPTSLPPRRSESFIAERLNVRRRVCPRRSKRDKTVFSFQKKQHSLCLKLKTEN